MLVLVRKHGESVVIGENVEVMVVAVLGNKVRLGFTAPRDVPIHRKEVWLEINPQRDGGEGEA